MRILVVISLFLAVASAQFFPGFPFQGNRGFGGEEQYAASLAGAPVGLYDKKNFGVGPYGRGSDVTGASLGGAKVGLYGKDHPQAAPSFFPYPVPFGLPYKVPYGPGLIPQRGYGRPRY